MAPRKESVATTAPAHPGLSSPFLDGAHELCRQTSSGDTTLTPGAQTQGSVTFPRCVAGTVA